MVSTQKWANAAAHDMAHAPMRVAPHDLGLEHARLVFGGLEFFYTELPNVGQLKAMYGK